MADEGHVAVLKHGVEVWNRWRQENPGIHPDLSDSIMAWIAPSGEGDPMTKGYRADLRHLNLTNTDLTRANFESIDLNHCDFTGANLFRAVLRRADLGHAILRDADLYEVDLYQADLAEADLTNARLTRARLVETNLIGATLENCDIYGIAAWDVTIDDTTNQKNLVISDPSRTWEVPIQTDNLEVAEFLYLMMNNPKLRQVIDTITSKVVLILGRFYEERKQVLDAIRDSLRTYGYVPVLFDFTPSENRDLTETVQLLANMAMFVIADVTDAKSIPQELSHIIPDLPSIPVQPILLESDRGYAMFEHWEAYPWVMPVFAYQDQQHLLDNLEARVIAPARNRLDGSDEDRLADLERQNAELARLRGETK